jgi:hypothetical protein
LDGFYWHGAGKNISTDDDLVRLDAANVFENSLERRKVGVNVIDRGDGHYGIPIHIDLLEPRMRAA